MYNNPKDYDKEIKIAGKIGKYYYFCDVRHPLANSNGWIYYHRHVASLKIGRWLLSDEHVHHIDKNETNNNPENLQILSPSEHSILEHNLKPKEKKIYYCINCGKAKSKKSKSGLCLECFLELKNKNKEITKAKRYLRSHKGNCNG